MRRHLPAQPHIDHLKEQAKDLLAAHRRAEPEALARIREALPAFAGRDDHAIAKGPFALHDAQSAIAREHGFPSWKELSVEVEARRARAAAGPRDLSVLRALMSGHPSGPLPGGVLERVRDEWSRAPEDRADVPLPTTLPLLAVRNALVVPDAVVPLQIGRAASIAALDEAAASTIAPSLLAVFAQRDASEEAVRFESLHPSGCLARVAGRMEGGFAIVQGLRFIELEALDPPNEVRAWAMARVRAPRAAGSDDTEVPALFAVLRERALRLARPLAEAPGTMELIESIQDPERLANLVVANIPAPVEDKARFAAEPTLPGRLRAAISMVDALLGLTDREGSAEG